MYIRELEHGGMLRMLVKNVFGHLPDTRLIPLM